MMDISPTQSIPFVNASRDDDARSCPGTAVHASDASQSHASVAYLLFEQEMVLKTMIVSVKGNLGDFEIDEHESSVVYLFNARFRADVALTTQRVAHAKSRSVSSSSTCR